MAFHPFRYFRKHQKAFFAVMLIVLAFAGDSTMTKSCLCFLLSPAVVAGALLALRAGAADFLRLVAGGVPSSPGCFLRAGTAVSLLKF